MPEYAYVAVGPDGRRRRGTASAASEDALAGQLRQRREYLLEAARTGVPSGLASVRLFERVTRRDVIFFTSQLSAVAASGVNLVEGLRDIEAQAAKAPLRDVIADVRRAVERGLSLSSAFERHPTVFGDLYANIIRAGEATGRVDKALDDLVQQLEWQEATRVRVRDAASYLIGFTIPRFARIYQSVNASLQLPLPTRVVQAAGTFVASNALVILAGLAVLFVLYRLRVQAPDGAEWRDRWLLRLPVAGDVARKLALARFAHFFGVLHASGVEVAPSLAVIERVIGNAHIARRFRAAAARVLAGEPLSRALGAVGEFSPLVIQMVALGEKTGEMSSSLQQVRQYYDREADRAVSRAIGVFGPAALLALAGVFVLIAVAFYLPIFKLAGAVAR